MRTRVETYFLQLFGSATLKGAAEAAATAELAAAKSTSIPVDVYKLARQKGFTVFEDLAGPSSGEGQLLPLPSGYRVRLRPDVTEARKRFSLAHEIGHSFFYINEGQGPRHVIGNVTTTERDAEEKICNLFAGTLLMPRDTLRHSLQGLSGSPSSLVLVLQQLAKSFKVSMPALLTRIKGLELSSPACLLVCSSVRSNPKTGLSPKLRIEFAFGIGIWSNRRFWNDTPIADVNISSALDLYDVWRRSKPISDSGQFVVEAGNLQQNSRPREYPEFGVAMSRTVMGVWKRESVTCTSSSALYTWKSEHDSPSAYVITVISPIADQNCPY